MRSINECNGKKHKRVCSKYERQLSKANELCGELQKQIISLNKTNVVRRNKRCEVQLAAERGRVRKLQEEVTALNNTVAEIRKTIKNRTEKVRYNVMKRTNDKKFDADSDRLKQQLKDLEKENDVLHCQLEELMGNNFIRSNFIRRWRLHKRHPGCVL